MIHRYIPLVLAALPACTSSSGPSYNEAHDTTNNWNVGGTPEDTALSLGASGSISVDGMVDDGHYDTEDLDNDTYKFTVTAGSTATVTLTGSDANAALQAFWVAVLDPTLHGTDVDVGSPATVSLSPGVWLLEMHAQKPSPITSSYPYTIEVSASAH